MQNNERNVKSDLTRGVQLFEFVTQHYMPRSSVRPVFYRYTSAIDFHYIQRQM